MKPMYLDAATRTKVEETGGANFTLSQIVKKAHRKSTSILPSITRRLFTVAKIIWD